MGVWTEQGVWRSSGLRGGRVVIVVRGLESMGGHTLAGHGEGTAGMRDEGWEAIPQVDGAADAKVGEFVLFGVNLGHLCCQAQQLANPASPPPP